MNLFHMLKHSLGSLIISRKQVISHIKVYAIVFSAEYVCIILGIGTIIQGWAFTSFNTWETIQMLNFAQYKSTEKAIIIIS